MKIYILFLSLFVTTMASAQSFTQHQWKNRLIVVVDKTKTQEKLQAQLLLFRTELEALEDRKLLVYQYTAQQVKLGVDEANNWKQEVLPIFLNQKMQSTTTFSVFLIGLDGGLKRQWTAIVPLQEIVDLIDSMPMRRAEMKRNGKS